MRTNSLRRRYLTELPTLIPAIAIRAQTGGGKMNSLVRKNPTILIFCALLSTFAQRVSFAQSSSAPDVLIAAPNSSSAPSQQLLNARLVLDVALFELGTTTKANLNGQANGVTVNNPEIDFNHTFGTGYDTSRIRLDGLWRITPRQHVQFMYFTSATSRTKTIENPIDWGNDQFQAGGEVTARNRISVYELSYEYAFVRKPTFELAASAGIHYTKTSLELSGVAAPINSSGASTGTSFEDTKTGSVPAPLPVIGLRAGWAFASHWLLGGSVRVFDFSYDQFHGHWTDYQINLKYMFNRYIGVGLGYDDFSTNLTVSQNKFNGRLSVGYRGGLIHITGAF
jgi:hypothetical protein